MKPFHLLAVLVLAGCANSPADRDIRAKVQDFVPVSVAGEVKPASITGHVDFFRVDFRAPSPSPTPTTSPK